MIKYALLMVEDHILNADLLEADLTMAGFDVSVAHGGAEALEQIDAYAAHFDALVTDIGLGEGPNGWEVGHHARDRFPGIPVVYASFGNERQWPVEGVEGSLYVEKPYRASQIVSAVSSLLDTIGWGEAQPM